MMDYFSGYPDKQFLIIMVSEDPWQYLRNFKIPNDLLVLSGLKGLKRRQEDIETVVIGDRFSWLHISDNEYKVIHEDFKQIDQKTILPVPYLLGAVKLRALTIKRDFLSFHPMYFSRLPDGFIFSPRKEWIVKIGYRPEIIPPNKKLFVEKYSLKMKEDYKHEQIPYRFLDLYDLSEELMKNIEEGIKELSRLQLQPILILTGDISDLLLLSLSDEWYVLTPRKDLIKSFHIENIDIFETKITEMEIMKIKDKTENTIDSVLCILIFKALKLIEKKYSLGYAFFGFAFNSILLSKEIHGVLDTILVNYLHNVFKCAWPSCVIPINLVYKNISLINLLIPRIRDIDKLAHYIGVNEDILKKYLSKWKQLKNAIKTCVRR